MRGCCNTAGSLHLDFVAHAAHAAAVAAAVAAAAAAQVWKQRKCHERGVLKEREPKRFIVFKSFDLMATSFFKNWKCFYPTKNALLRNLRLSSDAEALLTSTD